jgi:hypothetical protein
MAKVLVRGQAIVPVLPWKSDDFLESGVTRIFCAGVWGVKTGFYDASNHSIRRHPPVESFTRPVPSRYGPPPALFAFLGPHNV